MIKFTRLDTTNILLIAISAIFACWRPFETLLLAYAVLGPLHYLTEISWLHDRNYFTNSRKTVLFIGAGALIAGLFALTNLTLSLHHYEISSSNFIALLFVVAFVLGMSISSVTRMIGIGLIGLAAFIYGSTAIGLLITTLLTTVIHVFIFTALFMLYGARKAHSSLGLCAIGILLITPIVLVIAPLTWTANTSDWAALTYTGFFEMLTRLFMGESGKDLYLSIIQNPNAILVTRVLAFMYLHHYLNWFAKTSIIGWHKTSNPRLYAVVTLWVTSVSLYFWDYKMGVMWLLMLSLGHVILEFPLNVVTLRSLLALTKERNPRR